MNETPDIATPRRRVHVETWGCQMNVADSEQMLKLLRDENYQFTQSENEADLIILNTCHIREKAKHKVLSRLGVLYDLKEKRPGLKIAVAGCVAQAEGKKLLRDAPGIDVLLGPGKIADLPQLLRDSEGTKKPAMSIGFKPGRGDEPPPPASHQDPAPTLTGKNEITRFVNIIQGCNNFCTFCVVPFTRGREISRTPEDILQEVRAFLNAGAKEIMLLGQNVNSYGLDLVENGTLPATSAGPFVDLLRAVAQLQGLESLRFTTSNPHDFSQPLAQLFARYANMGRYIHLPVQSGNDRTLARMKRKVTVAEYLERVHWLRSIDPTMAISTDLIVGFPGETDAEFADTLALVEKVRFSFAFNFKYSPRPGTAAARFLEQVPESVKDERLAALNAVQDRITIALNESDVGKVQPVLFAYESKKNPGLFYGRTPHFRLVRVRADRNLVGTTQNVQITDANKTGLDGSLV